MQVIISLTHNIPVIGNENTNCADPDKIRIMKDREMNEFAWTGLFLVTGACFLGFSQLLRILDGGPVSMFSWVGFASLLIGLLYWVSASKSKSRRKHEEEWLS